MTLWIFSGLKPPGRRPAHQEAGVVVHEGAEVDPLVPTQEESEDVRLPELLDLRNLRQLTSALLRRPWWSALLSGRVTAVSSGDQRRTGWANEPVCSVGDHGRVAPDLLTSDRGDEHVERSRSG
jgi:hypothetical protein